MYEQFAWSLLSIVTVTVIFGFIFHMYKPEYVLDVDSQNRKTVNRTKIATISLILGILAGLAVSILNLGKSGVEHGKETNLRDIELASPPDRISLTPGKESEIVVETPKKPATKFSNVY